MYIIHLCPLYRKEYNFSILNKCGRYGYCIFASDTGVIIVMIYFFSNIWSETQSQLRYYSWRKMRGTLQLSAL